MRDSRVISFLLLLLLFSHWVVSNFLWPPWTASHQASLCFSISQSLLKLVSFESMMPSNHFILCHLLLLLPSIFPSPTVFSNESSHLVAKYWSFSISPFHEYSGLISFTIDWFDLLAIQGNLKSLQSHISKVSFFGAHPSLWSKFHIHTWLLEHTVVYTDLCQ